eukprot:gene28906-50813_t
MDIANLIQTVTIYALPVLFAITLHEAAHGYIAQYFGDDTAWSLGRVTLNPFKHIDPIGTIAMPLMLYFATSGAFLFGYAKPVPVRFDRLRNPKRDMIWVALAGPGANLLQAVLWGALMILLQGSGVNEYFFLKMCEGGVLVNIVMFAFNLFPLPPLDGGRIMTSILPNRYAYKFTRLEPYGFFIVLGLMMLNLLQYWMVPVIAGANLLLSLLIS